jgi:hypothetical protein
VFGLVGAALVIGRKLRYDVSVVAAFLVLNLVIGFMVSNIDWRAHLGGLAAGLTLGAAYAYAPPNQRAIVHVASAVGLAVAIVAIVAWRTAADVAAWSRAAWRRAWTQLSGIVDAVADGRPRHYDQFGMRRPVQEHGPVARPSGTVQAGARRTTKSGGSW